MNVTLEVWRQKGPDSEGAFEHYEMHDVDPFCTLFDLLESLNKQLTASGLDPVSYDYACKRGDCGRCAMLINGVPHGPESQTTTCQVRLSRFVEGEVITIEPFRIPAFPLIKDLRIDRSCLERLIEAGGFERATTTQGLIDFETGEYRSPAAPEFDEMGHYVPDPDQCITCGACVMACPNGASSMFQAVQWKRKKAMRGEVQALWGGVLDAQMASASAGSFGSCSDHRLCETVCPKNLKSEWITELQRDFGRLAWRRLCFRNPLAKAGASMEVSPD